VLLLALGLASPARAGELAFQGILSIRLAGEDPIGVPGSGIATVLSETGAAHLDSLELPASPFDVQGLVLPITDPAAAPIKGIQATVHNAAGVFRGGTLAGSMALGGVTKVCLFKACSLATANLSVPLGNIGAGGTIAVPPGSTSASVNLTVRGAPWTAGVAAVGTVTEMGFQHGPASNTSSTVGASGAIRLVSPIFVSTNIGACSVVPAFALLDLQLTPEPDTILLAAGGITALVMLGRSRRG
jgi:hypothetical protein